MKKGLLWRIALTCGILLLAAVYVVPSLTSSYSGEVKQGSPAWVQKFFPDSRINLGLDLRGGIHLTLGVEVDKALQIYVNQLARDLMQEANRKGMLMARPKILPEEKMEFVLMAPAKRAAFEELLAKEYSDLAVSSPVSVGTGNLQYSAVLRASKKAELESAVIDQALSTIRNRIDQFGVAEPDVRKQEGNRIIIQLPGMDNSQRAVDIIGKTAHLEFRLARSTEPGAPAPLGTEMLPMSTSRGSIEGEERTIAVETEVGLTGDHIKNAQAKPDSDKGGYLVTISFDRMGEQKFETLTGDNVNRLLAIVLDGKVYSVANIQTKISGDASLTGTFSAEEASDLALVLRSGSLPAPVTVLEERTVGPSLGKESIDMGITAAIISSALIMVFMVIYYSAAGLIANLMLVFDVLLILGGLALLGATLTLPGIAGIVLTLGMAIDANVLVFERIREELKTGATTADAIALGFLHAKRAIIDSNLTTIIFTVILYELGSGPIRGFAVTLTLGILASMFTAVFVSHIIFDLWLRKPGRKLSI